MDDFDLYFRSSRHVRAERQLASRPPVSWPVASSAATDAVAPEGIAVT
jgi:hypothetical protein